MSKESKYPIKDKLDHRILIPVILVSVIEYEIFTFAKGVVGIAGADAWLAMLLGMLLLIITTYFMAKLASLFPEENFFEYGKKIWGKPIMTGITFSYLLFWFSFVTILFQDFSDANRTLFLEETPLIIPLILLGIAVIWLVTYGLTPLVRLFQLMFPVLVIPLILIILLGLSYLRLDNYLPFLSGGIFPVIKGAVLFVGVLQGLEVILFLTPFIGDTNKVPRSSIIGIIIAGSLATTLGFLALGIMGVSNINASLWPGIETISYIEFPGFLLERYELFLTLPWLIGIFTTLCLFTYLIAYGIIDIWGLKRRKMVITLVVLLAIGAGYLIPHHAWLMQARTIVTQLNVIFIAVLPILSYVVARIRKKGGLADE